VHTPTIYYALNSEPRCIYQLRRSVASVRQHNCHIDVYAAITGHLNSDDRAYFADHRVTLLHSGSCRPLPPTFMKWWVLRCIPNDDVDLIYCDVDTLALGDIATLPGRLGDQDFHARIEYGCVVGDASYPYLVNTMLVTGPQVDYALLATLAAGLNAALLPVCNTGVMIFRNGLASRLIDAWPLFVDLYRGFRRKLLPYPCRHPHHIDEICAALVLGTIKGVTFSPLCAELCPWFAEYATHGDHRHAIVLHTGIAQYSAALFAFDGAQAVRQFLDLPRACQTPKTARARSLTLGTTCLPCSPRMLRYWARLGTAAIRCRRHLALGRA
jgi:hypothetical protein